jgi:hypothetical protein
MRKVLAAMVAFAFVGAGSATMMLIASKPQLAGGNCG